MSLIGFLVSLVVLFLVVGLIHYLLDLLPLDPKLKSIIKAIIIVIVILILLGFLFGAWRVPRFAWP